MAQSRKETFRAAGAIAKVWAAPLGVASLTVSYVPFFKGLLFAFAPLVLLSVVERWWSRAKR